MTRETDFVSEFNRIARMNHADMRANGFWDVPRNHGETIALIHSEASEALEAIRHGNPPDQHCPAFGSLEVEYADLILRIMDDAVGRHLRVAEALLAKMAYNATRPPKHGKDF